MSPLGRADLRPSSPSLVNFGADLLIVNALDCGHGSGIQIRHVFGRAVVRPPAFQAGPAKSSARQPHFVKQKDNVY